MKDFCLRSESGPHEWPDPYSRKIPSTSQMFNFGTLDTLNTKKDIVWETFIVQWGQSILSNLREKNQQVKPESQHWSAYKLCNLLSRAWILACREQNSNGNGKGGTYRSSCPAHCSLSGTNSSPANSLSQQHVLMASVSLWTILCSSHLKSVNTNTVTG